MSCRLVDSITFPPPQPTRPPRVVESKVLEMGFHIRQHLRVNLFRLLTSQGDHTIDTILPSTPRSMTLV